MFFKGEFAIFVKGLSINRRGDFNKQLNQLRHSDMCILKSASKGEKGMAHFGKKYSD